MFAHGLFSKIAKSSVRTRCVCTDEDVTCSARNLLIRQGKEEAFIYAGNCWFLIQERAESKLRQA